MLGFNCKGIPKGIVDKPCIVATLRDSSMMKALLFDKKIDSAKGGDSSRTERLMGKLTSAYYIGGAFPQRGYNQIILGMISRTLVKNRKPINNELVVNLVKSEFEQSFNVTYFNITETLITPEAHVAIMARPGAKTLPQISFTPPELSDDMIEMLKLEDHEENMDEVEANII